MLVLTTPLIAVNLARDRSTFWNFFSRRQWTNMVFFFNYYYYYCYVRCGRKPTQTRDNMQTPKAPSWTLNPCSTNPGPSYWEAAVLTIWASFYFTVLHSAFILIISLNSTYLHYFWYTKLSFDTLNENHIFIDINICVYPLVINAVLIVDVEQFVFNPTDLLGWFFTSLMVQTVFLIKLS